MTPIHAMRVAALLLLPLLWSLSWPASAILSTPIINPTDALITLANVGATKIKPTGIAANLETTSVIFDASSPTSEIQPPNLIVTPTTPSIPVHFPDTHPSSFGFPTPTAHVGGNITRGTKESPEGARTPISRGPHILQGLSSFNRAAIRTRDMTLSVDGTRPDAVNPHHNVGFLVVILHQATGQRLAAPQLVQPWALPGTLEALLDAVQPGRIVLIVLRPSPQEGLSGATVRHLRALGSVFAQHLAPNTAWFWAHIKGGPTLVEGLTAPSKLTEQQQTTALHVEAWAASADHEADLCPAWPHDPPWDARRALCDSYELYGDFCDCKRPYVPDYRDQDPPPPLSRTVVVMPATRGHLLLRSLKSVFRASGVSLARLVVVSDSTYSELALLCKALQLLHVVLPNDKVFAVESIAQLYSSAVTFVLERFPATDSMIFLEDDVEVSPDFFMFMAATAPLLKTDAGLYCVSAHNDLSYVHNSYNTTRLLRTASMPNYGWLALTSFLLEMVELINKGGVPYDWDIGVYMSLRRGRECIVPEVSRSFHFGSSGLHLDQYAYAALEAWQNINRAAPSAYDIDGLNPENHEVAIHEAFSQAIFLDPSKNSFCTEVLPVDPLLPYVSTGARQEVHVNTDIIEGLHPSLQVAWVREMLPDNITVGDFTPETILVMFFEMNNTDELMSDVFGELALCLRVHCCTIREAHNGLMRLRLGPAHLYLVGYPTSPYSHYKPDSLPVFRYRRSIHGTLVTKLSEAVKQKKSSRILEGSGNPQDPMMLNKLLNAVDSTNF